MSTRTMKCKLQRMPKSRDGKNMVHKKESYNSELMPLYIQTDMPREDGMNGRMPPGMPHDKSMKIMRTQDMITETERAQVYVRSIVRELQALLSQLDKTAEPERSNCIRALRTMTMKNLSTETKSIYSVREHDMPEFNRRPPRMRDGNVVISVTAFRGKVVDAWSNPMPSTVKNIITTLDNIHLPGIYAVEQLFNINTSCYFDSSVPPFREVRLNRALSISLDYWNEGLLYEYLMVGNLPGVVSEHTAHQFLEAKEACRTLGICTPTELKLFSRMVCKGKRKMMRVDVICEEDYMNSPAQTTRSGFIRSRDMLAGIQAFKKNEEHTEKSAIKKMEECFIKKLTPGLAGTGYDPTGVLNLYNYSQLDIFASSSTSAIVALISFHLGKDIDVRFGTGKGVLIKHRQNQTARVVHNGVTENHYLGFEALTAYCPERDIDYKIEVEKRFYIGADNTLEGEIRINLGTNLTHSELMQNDNSTRIRNTLSVAMKKLAFHIPVSALPARLSAVGFRKALGLVQVYYTRSELKYQMEDLKVPRSEVFWKDGCLRNTKQILYNSRKNPVNEEQTMNNFIDIAFNRVRVAANLEAERNSALFSKTPLFNSEVNIIINKNAGTIAQTFRESLKASTTADEIQTTLLKIYSLRQASLGIDQAWIGYNDAEPDRDIRVQLPGSLGNWTVSHEMGIRVKREAGVTRLVKENVTETIQAQSRANRLLSELQGTLLMVNCTMERYKGRGVASFTLERMLDIVREKNFLNLQKWSRGKSSRIFTHQGVEFKVVPRALNTDDTKAIEKLTEKPKLDLMSRTLQMKFGVNTGTRVRDLLRGNNTVECSTQSEQELFIERLNFSPEEVNILLESHSFRAFLSGQPEQGIDFQVDLATMSEGTIVWDLLQNLFAGYKAFDECRERAATLSRVMPGNDLEIQTALDTKIESLAGASSQREHEENLQATKAMIAFSKKRCSSPGPSDIMAGIKKIRRETEIIRQKRHHEEDMFTHELSKMLAISREQDLKSQQKWKAKTKASRAKSKGKGPGKGKRTK